MDHDSISSGHTLALFRPQSQQLPPKAIMNRHLAIFPPRSSYKARSLPPFKNSLITLGCEILQVDGGTSRLYSFAPHCKALGGKKGEVK
jgi:hypothetical protein